MCCPMPAIVFGGLVLVALSRNPTLAPCPNSRATLAQQPCQDHKQKLRNDTQHENRNLNGNKSILSSYAPNRDGKSPSYAPQWCKIATGSRHHMHPIGAKSRREVAIICTQWCKIATGSRHHMHPMVHIATGSRHHMVQMSTGSRQALFQV